MKRVEQIILAAFLGFCWLSMWHAAAQEQKDHLTQYYTLNAATSDSGLQVELNQREKNEEIVTHSNFRDRARYLACNDYRIVIANGGHITQKSLEVIFFLPGNVDCISYNERNLGKNELPAQLVWTLGNLAPGQQLTTNLVVQFSYALGSVLLLFAIHNQETAEFCYISVPLFLLCNGCFPTVTGNFDKQGVAIGKTIQYVIKIENETLGKKVFQIVNTIPSGLQFISANGNCTVEQGNIVFPDRALFSGEKMEYEIMYKAIKSGTIKNFTVMKQGEHTRETSMEGILHVK